MPTGSPTTCFEAARFDHGWGRSFARDVKGAAEAIMAEVVRQLGDTIDAATIKVAVEDVVAKRRPRW